jgi:hypothetical protein
MYCSLIPFNFDSQYFNPDFCCRSSDGSNYIAIKENAWRWLRKIKWWDAGFTERTRIRRTGADHA